ncbi:MAG: MarC family protein [Rubricoccaceae bacterium]|nr:MarC family protein [Rubricoccaceae bacterium]
MTFVSAFVLLFLVMDPVGNVPMFLAALRPVASERRRRVVARELLIALGVLLLFFFAGPYLLRLLGISEPALTIAGGIILFLIALRMIFPSHGTLAEEVEGEPFVVPLAIPFVAGPSAMAAVMLLVSGDPGRWPVWLGALVGAWGASAGILLLANRLSHALGQRGLVAIERLMGMVLTAIAVEMFMRGVSAFSLG